MPPAAPTVHGALRLLDEAGIEGELALREERAGPRRDDPDVGPPAVGARGVPPPARAVADVRPAPRRLHGLTEHGPRRRPHRRSAVRLERPGDARRGAATTSSWRPRARCTTRWRGSPREVVVADLTYARARRRVQSVTRAARGRPARRRAACSATTRTSNPVFAISPMAEGFDLVVPRSRMAREGRPQLASGPARRPRLPRRALALPALGARARAGWSGAAPGPGRPTASRARQPRAAPLADPVLVDRAAAAAVLDHDRGAALRRRVAVAPLHQRDDRSATGRGPCR